MHRQTTLLVGMSLAAGVLFVGIAEPAGARFCESEMLSCDSLSESPRYATDCPPAECDGGAQTQEPSCNAAPTTNLPSVPYTESETCATSTGGVGAGSGGGGSPPPCQGGSATQTRYGASSTATASARWSCYDQYGYHGLSWSNSCSGTYEAEVDYHPKYADSGTYRTYDVRTDCFQSGQVDSSAEVYGS